MLNNYKLVLPFVPEKDDGDTFIYTEMLDRGNRKGNNGQRLLKTFYHRSQEEFSKQFETIEKLCDMGKVRACTRLAPRSYKKVAGQFLRLVTEAYITENFVGMKTLYNRACGITSPNQKLWLFDVDILNDDTLNYERTLSSLGVLVTTIPSKKGLHYISKPFDGRTIPIPEGISLHKDNPTNLYIPDEAD